MRDSKVAIITIVVAFIAITRIDVRALVVSGVLVLLSALFLYLLKKKGLEKGNLENVGESGDLKSAVELFEANYVEGTLFGFTSTFEKKIDESLTLLASTEKKKLSQLNVIEPTIILISALHALVLIISVSMNSGDVTHFESALFVVSPIIIYRSLQTIFEKSKRSTT